MPFDSRAYRVLIASPSDVEDEREIAVRVIQEWNDLYSYSRGVVLLPLRWETHTAPEYGTRPQEVINRAIVDQCDLLVGIFWTRIGTPTEVADSGTIEEISRVASAGKPVMLYFSKVGMDPDRIDLSQLARLKEFKDRTYPNALTESYKSQIEFRDKFAKQLELKVRDLQKADDKGQPPPLKLTLVGTEADHEPASRTVTLPQIDDLEAVLNRETDEVRKRIEAAITAAVSESIGAPVLLAVSNTGTSGIRNLYIQVSITASSEHVDVIDAPLYRFGSPLSTDLFATWSYATSISRVMEPKWSNDLSDVEGLTRQPDGWYLAFEWGALQPQRIRAIKPQLVVRAKADAHVEFEAKVFADSFPEPVRLKTELDIIVRPKRVKLSDLIPNLESLRRIDEVEGVVVRALGRREPHS